MSQYKVLKTTMGRKYRIRMTDEEQAEKELFNIILVAAPFVTAAAMFFLWIRMGG